MRGVTERSRRRPGGSVLLLPPPVSVAWPSGLPDHGFGFAADRISPTIMDISPSIFSTIKPMLVPAWAHMAAELQIVTPPSWTTSKRIYPVHTSEIIAAVATGMSRSSRALAMAAIALSRETPPASTPTLRVAYTAESLTACRLSPEVLARVHSGQIRHNTERAAKTVASSVRLKQRTAL